MLSSSRTFGNRQSLWPPKPKLLQNIRALHQGSESLLVDCPSLFTSAVRFCHMRPVQLSVTVPSPWSVKRLSSFGQPVFTLESCPNKGEFGGMKTSQRDTPSQVKHRRCPVSGNPRAADDAHSGKSSVGFPRKR